MATAAPGVWPAAARASARIPAHAWRSLAAKSTWCSSRGPTSRDVILRSQSAISAGFAVPS